SPCLLSVAPSFPGRIHRWVSHSTPQRCDPGVQSAVWLHFGVLARRFSARDGAQPRSVWAALGDLVFPVVKDHAIPSRKAAAGFRASAKIAPYCLQSLDFPVATIKSWATGPAGRSSSA